MTSNEEVCIERPFWYLCKLSKMLKKFTEISESFHKINEKIKFKKRNVTIFLQNSEITVIFSYENFHKFGKLSLESQYLILWLVK